MNHAPNTTHWPLGSLVLHDADAKRPEMLMRVIGYQPDGRCQTRYAEPNDINGDALLLRLRRKPEVWENEIRVLHDPARFGVNVIHLQQALAAEHWLAARSLSPTSPPPARNPAGELSAR